MNKNKGGERIAEEKKWKPGETAYPNGILNREKVVDEAEDSRREFRH